MYSYHFFHMWRICCPYLFVISSSFNASVGLCFVIVAFPGYLHLCFKLLFGLGMIVMRSIMQAGIFSYKEIS